MGYVMKIMIFSLLIALNKDEMYYAGKLICFNAYTKVVCSRNTRKGFIECLPLQQG